MVRENEVRQGEVAVEPPPVTDAGLVFIGQIRTPWTSRLMMLRQGRADGPVCRIEIFAPGTRRSKASSSSNAWRCSTGCISRGEIMSGKPGQ